MAEPTESTEPTEPTESTESTEELEKKIEELKETEESLYDRFREIVKCGICLEYMIKPAKFKVCKHSFCYTCIEKHLNSCKKGQGTCPKCGLKKKYDFEVDRPRFRSLFVDQTVDEIITTILPEERKLSLVDKWYTEHRIPIPVRRIAHLTDEQKSLTFRHCDKEKLSIRLNGAELTKLESPNMLVAVNSTVHALRKAISTELNGDESMFEKVNLSVDGKELDDDLTMVAIFVHYFKYQAVPMPIDLKIEE